MFALTGCKEESDGGEADGNKWELNVTVDATTDASDYADAANASGTSTLKKRYFKETTSSSKVAAIETTIKVNTSNTLKNTSTKSESSTTTKGSVNQGYAVIGYMFGYNKNSDDSSKRDFYLLGIKPLANTSNGVYYLEKYMGVDGKTSEATGWTKESSMGTYTSYSEGATTDATLSKGDEFAIKTAPDTTDEGYLTYTITITQDTAGTYVVKLNGDTLATITDDTHTSTIDGTEGYATGSVCAYVMAPVGTKVEATYAVDKSKKDEIIKGTYNVAGGSLNEFDSIVLE